MPSDASLTSALAGVRAATQRTAARRGLAETPEWAAVDAALVAAGTLDAADGWSCSELDGLASRFRLDDDARRLLLVVAACDLDPIVARAYGALSGRRGTQPVTIGLALELCSIPSVSRRARAALGPDGALRRWLLIDELDDDELWFECPLNASADVLDALLGQVATHPGGTCRLPLAGRTPPTWKGWIRCARRQRRSLPPWSPAALSPGCWTVRREPPARPRRCWGTGRPASPAQWCSCGCGPPAAASRRRCCRR